MLIELVTMIFATTGVFSGSATCEKIADGVGVNLQMTVESNSQHIPADSISTAMVKLFESAKALKLKLTSIAVQTSSEGKRYVRNGKSSDEKEFYADKSIKVTTRDFDEIQYLLQAAAGAGFLMNGSPEYFVNNSDSLKTSCIEHAIEVAVGRAKAAKNALNGISMSVLKITDSDEFNLYTSDDSHVSDESIDAFFSNKVISGHSARHPGFGSKSRIFYKIAPAQIKVVSSVRILVNIKTNE